MKFIKTYESFKSSKKGNSINEEFIGSLLKNLIPDWARNLTVKNKKGIDKALVEYKKEYEQLSKNLSDILSSNVKDIDKKRLKSIQDALVKKRNLVSKKLESKLNELTKDNEKSKNYADFKRNTIELELINSELEQYGKMDLEETEYVKNLKENSKKSEELKNEKEKELKKELADKERVEKSTEIKSNDDITPGDILLYRNSDDDMCVIRITDDGSIQRISNIVSKKRYEAEISKPEDKRNTIGLFKKEDGGSTFDNPHKGEFDRLKRISKSAQEKFKEES
jgi:hypothetical protein